MSEQVLWAVLTQTGKIKIDEWGFPAVYKTQQQGIDAGYEKRDLCRLRVSYGRVTKEPPHA